jgi:uncharacterized YigZ family protein
LTVPIDSYYTISQLSKGIFKDKGSKFLSFAYPVKKEDEIKELMTEIKKDFFDARHHCYAYRLGAEKLIYRVNDDGEPSGTAGRPILGQIVSKDLTNILIVVVRYFGGTLLGTSGLINAYKIAAAEAILNATVVEKFVYASYRITFDYQLMNQVMKIVKDYDLLVSDQGYDLTCYLVVKVRLSKNEQVSLKFDAIEGLAMIYLEYE